MGRWSKFSLLAWVTVGAFFSLAPAPGEVCVRDSGLFSNPIQAQAFSNIGYVLDYSAQTNTREQERFGVRADFRIGYSQPWFYPQSVYPPSSIYPRFPHYPLSPTYRQSYYSQQQSYFNQSNYYYPPYYPHNGYSSYSLTETAQKREQSFLGKTGDFLGNTLLYSVGTLGTAAAVLSPWPVFYGDSFGISSTPWKEKTTAQKAGAVTGTALGLGAVAAGLAEFFR